jgi:hypothetical protein
MKNCAGFLLILLLISCNYNHKKDLPDVRGVFNLLSASAADTTIAKQKKLKIYANDCFMYLSINPADSVSAFGIGTYTTDAGKVTENMVYSAADTIVNTTAFSRTLNIKQNDKGFEQTIPVTIPGNKKKQVIEEYASVGTTQKSPLDGAWKQTAEYSIKGNDTTKLFNEMQWKIFFGGYWAAGLVFTDSLQKKYTGIIYGKFTTVSNKEIKENVSVATLNAFIGHVYDVSIDIKNNDSFSQVLTAPNGTKYLVEFIRVKK